jgi:catechol 2,3-dioxygenase-like lactoylglutathione lyase family enzyme
MTPELDLIGLVVADMATTLAFYRDLGLALPVGADSQPYVEHTLAGGVQLAWDTEEVMASFDAGWAA